MYKYKHKETGLFLTKGKHGYSSVYYLSQKGTTWNKKVLGTLSMTKDPSKYGFNKFFNISEFEIVEFNLIEK